MGKPTHMLSTPHFFSTPQKAKKKVKKVQKVHKPAEQEPAKHLKQLDVQALMGNLQKPKRKASKVKKNSHSLLVNSIHAQSKPAKRVVPKLPQAVHHQAPTEDSDDDVSTLGH